LASEGKDRAEELAVMMDTFKPLGLTDAARSVSDPTYPWSWAGHA
jgi:homogentisate 1,2-dioxygenase